MTDPHFDRALRAAARRGRPAGPCVDPAVLAAYVDRSVSDAERASIEAHLADCSACMEHLALLAAVDVPDQPADGTDPFSIAGLLPRWSWLVPVAAVALVIAIWVREPNSGAPSAALPRLERATASPASQEARNEPPISADEGRLGARTPAAAPAIQKRAAGGALQEAESAPPKAKADKPASLSAADSGLADVAAKRDKKTEGKASNEDAALGGTPTPPGVASAPAPTPTVPAAADALRERRAEEAAQVQQPAQAAGATKIERQAYARVDGLMKDTGVAPLVVTVGPTVRVRAIDGRVERSTNGGASWITEHSLGSDRLRAGVCPSEEVCWLGGDAGVVWQRGASGTWTRQVVVADAAAAVVAITAADGSSATATLRDGRRFTTTDGGRTWVGVPVDTPRQ